MDFTFIDVSHANIAAILAIPLAVITFFVVIGSLLMLRQAHQMTEVLPTPLSPVVRVLVIGYVIFAVLVFVLTIKTVFS